MRRKDGYGGDTHHKRSSSGNQIDMGENRVTRSSKLSSLGGEHDGMGVGTGTGREGNWEGVRR